MTIQSPIVLREIDTSTIEYGLDSILSQLEYPLDGSKFPRRIMTWLTKKQGRNQVQVSSREEAISKFKQSGLVDCRLSIFPYPVPEVNGINAQVPTGFLSRRCRIMIPNYTEPNLSYYGQGEVTRYFNL